MIVSSEPFVVSVMGKDTPCLRVIRKHDHVANVYYTDSYYQRIPWNENELEPMFCIIRNMTKWERGDQFSSGNVCHPFRYTRIVAGSSYRITQLFRKENESSARELIRNFPIESKEITSVILRDTTFPGERRHIIPNADDIFSVDSSFVHKYHSKSRPFIAEDHDDVLLTALLEEERGCSITFNIWRIAHMYRDLDFNLDDLAEAAHEMTDTYLEVILFQNLYQVPFFNLCKHGIQSEEAAHPDDGMYLYTMHGRFVVMLYINHYHGEYWISVTDLVEKFLETNERKNSNRVHERGNGSDNLFDDMENYCLSEDVLFR